MQNIVILGWGMGMGMATQLELISVYACCSTRAVMRAAGEK